ncbi:hypothetical protein K491DRAFT_717678 [Lophiostoma macrostomum CBS 122681]|uniref:Uncharacterized protein n=1 Tax=Lophiostoma macrostomum CBS 122681 TaxID=1314788 RepID=A0A6A6T5J9_9PLEO|nr:hypothetical protein K491DRAFT_717678 [Lophiostoma macrostomum CBS 122681]
MNSLLHDHSPDSKSVDLVLGQPTAEEWISVSNTTWASWGDSLPLPVYLQESEFLTTVPLARDGGLTPWILIDGRLPVGRRPILASCETIRKRALISTAGGHVEEGIVHGIASVFTSPEYRRRGYAARMLQELAQILRTWQIGNRRCLGTILYSDIGKTYYANIGWRPNATNRHVEFQAIPHSKHSCVRGISGEGLQNLCERDENIVRTTLTVPDNEIRSRVTIIPDLDHMLWHISKEEFACQYLFGRVPKAKGAIAGDSGCQVWVIWTHRYYTSPEIETADNVLYILRLVMERDKTATRLPTDSSKLLNDGQYAEQFIYLKAVLQAAQDEAAEWGLKIVKLWDPTPLVLDMLSHSGMHYNIVDREEDSIASGRWYREKKDDDANPPYWLNNEHYAWC